MTPFWKHKRLPEMTREEWESLCDRCGKCCLHKLENDSDGLVYYTDVACRLLDTETGQCSDYAHRHRHVPDCLTLDPASLATLDWLPSTCAYRLLHEGRDLPDWHPLVSGDPDSVRRAGHSVAGRCVHEAPGLDPETRIVIWPE